MKLLCCLSLGLCLIANPTFAEDGPPNWKAYAEGQTKPANDGTFQDVDTFAGKSTHLGRFTGEGRHLLYPDLSFEGYATWTSASGDELDVIYTGNILSLEELPYPVEADFEIVGGTGRFANTTGSAYVTGGFTGVPGDLFFDLEGTLEPQGK